MKIKHSYQPLTYITYSIVGITVLAGMLLSCNIPIFPGISVNGSTLALTQTTTANTSVRVNNFCSMTANIQPGEEHSTILIGGQYKEDIGKTTIATFCNDPNGYAIYTIGYTGGDEGVAEGANTVLHSNALGSNYDIVTGIATSGDVSNWAMKVSSVPGTYEPTILSDDDGPYSDYHTVPQNYTKVADFSSSTDATIGSSLTTTYSVYVSPTQPAGTYEGQVKYVLVHPNNSLGPNFNMQNVDEWGPTIAIGEEVTADDLRDGKSYSVRRMCMEGTGNTWQQKEANCTSSMLWMTQNLDLDLNSTTTLTSRDTDLNVAGDGPYTSGYTTDAYGMISWVPASTTITSINTGNAEFNGWAYSDDMAYSADPDGGIAASPWYISGYSEGFASEICSNNACNYLIGGEMANKYFQRTPFDINGNHGKIGNYYNWPAAIASNDSSGLTTSTYSDVANNPKNSICPRGWRLPTISSKTTDNEFAILNRVYNFNATNSGWGLINSPVYITRAGDVYKARLSGAGQVAEYWSSTIYSSQQAYYLYLRSGNVNVSGKYQRGDGRLIRCVSDY